MDDMLLKQLGGAIARHMLTAVAGTLVALGAVSPDQQNNFITIGAGLAVWGIGFAWSWWQKAHAAKASPHG